MVSVASFFTLVFLVMRFIFSFFFLVILNGSKENNNFGQAGQCFLLPFFDFFPNKIRSSLW